MKGKFAWFALVSLAAGLLFAACPIQFDPYAAPDVPGGEIESVGTWSGIAVGSALGYFGIRDGDSSLIVQVILVFDNGVIDEVHTDTPHETSGYTDVPASLWALSIMAGTLPAVLPMGHNVDAFTGGTVTINQLRVAFLDAMDDARAQAGL